MDSATLSVQQNVNVDIKSQKVNEKQKFVRTEILFIFLYLYVFIYLNILYYLTFNSLYFQFKDG